MDGGVLKIVTRLDNSKLDKDVESINQKIDKLQQDNGNLSEQEQSLKEEINTYENLCNSAETYRSKIKELKVEMQSLTKSGFSEQQMPQISALQAEIDSTKSSYQSVTKEIDKQAKGIDKVYNALDKVKLKQEQNNSKIDQYRDKISTIKFNNVESSVKGIGKNLTDHIKSIATMAVAVFGLRTAYMAVRNAINELSQSDPQLKADIDYIKYALASVLEPVVKRLIQWVYQLLNGINAIAKAWLNVNLFANASSSKWKSMQDSSSATAKNAKEIKNSLAGFDEMNTLSDNSSSSSSSSSAPSIDLGADMPIPGWATWIIEHGPQILAIIGGVTAGILAFKLGLSGVKALGITLIITGIILLIQDVIKFLKDPTWEGFIKILQDIAIIALGIGIVLGSWPVIIGAVIALIVTVVIQNWDKIKAILGQVGSWIYNHVISPVVNFFKGCWEAIKAIFSGVGNWFKNIFNGALNGIKAVFNGITSFFGGIWDKIVNIFSGIGTKVGEVIGSAFKTVVNAVLWTVETVLNTPINAINGLLDIINAVPGINLGKLSTFNLPRLARGGVISQPTNAIIGEDGKEAVVPLENNMEWLDLLADKLATKGGSGGAYIIQLDGRTIARGQARRKEQLSFETNGRC